MAKRDKTFTIEITEVDVYYFGTFAYSCAVGLNTAHIVLESYLDKEFDLVQSKSICDHEFKHYVGITHSYDYCVKCDEKTNG